MLFLLSTQTNLPPGRKGLLTDDRCEHTSPGALLDVEFTTTTPTNALLSNITYNNSSPFSNAVVSAFDMNFMDSSTAANLSKQTARIAYTRQPGATGE